ncbi:unnamed protein product [Heligmosomoides polygyrus]|uniref:Uncharacterized protein n=1 Tax=Heligmosomoides polygyrus TaxID=6339 RepID=A0A3P8AEM5_HELPZ|nr:unnamed protein product [Heligmosomoides polygyrus]
MELVLLNCGVDIKPNTLSEERQKESLINIHSNFDKVSKVCNVYDEASYCQQIVVDHRVSLVAVSFKCECPKGWFCPSDPSETPAFTEYALYSISSSLQLRAIGASTHAFPDVNTSIRSFGASVS